MDREERCAAKAQMVAQMQTGQSWQEAATRAGAQTSRTAAYRLLQHVRIEGAIALRDQRHGHPAKLRGPVREWLAEFCRAAPESTGRTAQAALFERFGLEVSVSQINRLRAALGVRRPARGKNQPNGPPSEPTWHEGAGSLLLLAAAQETGVIAALEQALPTGEQVASRLAHTTPVTRRQSLLTLLFLGAVGLRRTWDETKLHGRRAGLAYRTPTRLWLLAHRTVSLPGGACRGRRSTDRCPGEVDRHPLVGEASGARPATACHVRGWT